MKSHGKSKAVLSAIIFEVNLLQSSRFGEAYRDKLRENPGVYYADAEEKIAALNPEKIGWYFTETAIVCYLEPYTIALPEEGYVEAELPIEDDRE